MGPITFHSKGYIQSKDHLPTHLHAGTALYVICKSIKTVISMEKCSLYGI